MARSKLDAEARAGMPNESFVALADGVTHYEWGGPEDGPPVVLVHGFSSPMFIWDKNFAALIEAGFHVLRYDLYGRGLSDRPRTRYTPDLFDRQLLALLDAHGVTGPVDIVGLSMGGAITMIFTDRHPERVGKIALIAPAGLGKPPGGAGLLKLPGVGEALIAALGNRIIQRTITEQSAGDPVALRVFEEEYARQLSYDGCRRALLSTLRHFPMAGLEGVFERVGRQKRAGLLVWGTADTVVPYALHERVQALAPSLAFCPVDGAGHTVNYQKPDEVNRYLVESLKGRARQV